MNSKNENPLPGLLAKLEAAFREVYPQFDEIMKPPATGEEIRGFKDKLQLDLPESFYQLYRWHNGSTKVFFDGMDFLSLDEVISVKKVMDKLEESGTFKQWLPGNWWNTAWVPLLDNRSYDTIVVDTKGTFGGHKGQIIQWSKDSPARPFLFPSIEKWIESFTYNLKNGCYGIEDHLPLNDNRASMNVEDGYLALVSYSKAEKNISRICPGYPVYNSAKMPAETLKKRPPLPDIPGKPEGQMSSLLTLVKRFPAPSNEAVRTMACSKDWLAISQHPGLVSKAPTLSLLSRTGDEIRVLETGETMVTAVCFVPGKNYCAYITQEQKLHTLKLYHLETKKSEEIDIWEGDYPSTSLSSDNNGFFLAFNKPGTAVLINVKDGESHYTYQPETDRPYNVSCIISPEGKILAVAAPGDYKTPPLTIHDVPGKKQVARYPAKHNIGLRLFGPSSRLLFGIHSGAVGLEAWDIEKGKPYLPGRINETLRNIISLATDGTYLFGGMYYGKLKAFDLEDGKEVLSWHLFPEKKKYVETDIAALCVQVEEHILYAGGTDGQVMEFSLLKGTSNG